MALKEIVLYRNDGEILGSIDRCTVNLNKLKSNKTSLSISYKPVL